MFDIPEELKKLPQKPGVYIMKDSGGVIIYVGKAINLRNRVRSYFHAGPAVGAKTVHLVGHIAEFEYIITDNELEALILERNLIKKHHPKYNIMLKDDKNYPYLKLTLNESYPRLFMTRRHLKDQAKYYGPYPGAGALRDTIDLVNRIWPLRRCHKKSQDLGNDRPCLNYHIGLCKAPCAGYISQEEYGKLVAEVTEFLNGKRQPVLAKLEEQMAAYAEALEFEKAAELRDTIAAAHTLDEKQKIESVGGDQDVIALAGGEDMALAQVFFVRGGKLLGREHFVLDRVNGASREQTMCAFIKQFYGETTFIPKELLLENDIAEREVIAEWLSTLKSRSVSIIVPQKGEKLKMVRMAATNAAIAYEQLGERLKREHDSTVGALNEIASALGLDSGLKRIEAYDISDTQGYETVASMVVFDSGRPKRSDYRKFKIKTVIGANDCASMEEVVRRRFMRYKNENGDPNGKFSTAPDILFIDGGQSQVAAAEAVLRDLGLKLPVCGMVKDDRHRTRGLYYNGREVSMPYTSEGFKLVTRIQDEVHRFAIEYHRKLRESASMHSVLDDIPGIGPARRKALMKHFGSIEAIHKADIEELIKAPAMNSGAANAVYGFFHSL